MTTTDFTYISLPNHALFVKHVILDSLQTFFTDAKIPGFIYDKNINVSDIYILDEYTDKQLGPALKPKIVFHCGPLQTYNASIGNLISFDPVTSRKRMGKMIIGRSTITCESRNGIEAGGLASIIMNMIISNYSQFMRRGFKWISALGISEERIVDADAETRRTQYDVAIEHHHSVMMDFVEESDPLTNVAVTADFNSSGNASISSSASFGEVGFGYDKGFENQGKVVNPTYPLKFP